MKKYELFLANSDDGTETEPRVIEAVSNTKGTIDHEKQAEDIYDFLRGISNGTRKQLFRIIAKEDYGISF